MISKFNSIKISKRDFLVLILWTVYLWTNIICEYSEFAFEHNLASIDVYISKIVLIGLFIIIILSSKITKKELLINGIMLVLCAVNYYFTKSFTMVAAFLFALVARKVTMSRFLKWDIINKIIILIFLISMSLLGIIENIAGFYGTRFKHAYGFSHPNILAVFCISILIEILCFRYDKMKIYDYLFQFICIYILYQVSLSRSSIFTYIFVLILLIVCKKTSIVINNTILRKGIIVLPFICLGISIIITFIGDKLVVLNTLVTGRIYMASQFYNEYGLSVLGQKVVFISSRMSLSTHQQVAILDNVYLKLGIQYGLVCTIVFCLLYTVLNYNLIKIKNYPLLICSIFYIILGLGETYFIIITFNFTFLLLFHVVDNDMGMFRKPKKHSFLFAKKGKSY